MLRLLTLLFLAIFVSCNFQLPGPGLSDFTLPVAGNYIINRTSAHGVSVIPAQGWTKDASQIPAKLVEVAWDDRYVLGKQQHLKKDDPNEVLGQPVSGEYSYWILDTSVPVAYGPLSLVDFKDKRANLGLSDELQLRDIEEFRP